MLVLTGNLDIGVYAMDDVEQWCDLVSGIKLSTETYPYDFLDRGYL